MILNSQMSKLIKIQESSMELCIKSGNKQIIHKGIFRYVKASVQNMQLDLYFIELIGASLIANDPFGRPCEFRLSNSIYSAEIIRSEVSQTIKGYTPLVINLMGCDLGNSTVTTKIKLSYD